MAYEKSFIYDFARPMAKGSIEDLDQELKVFGERLKKLDKARQLMANGLQTMLQGLNMAYPDIDLSDPNYKDTPDRMARAYIEICQGMGSAEKEIFSTSFPIGKYEHVIIVKDIDFISLCCHHFFPFVGKAHIGYLPQSDSKRGSVVGLSKLARIVDSYAARPQLQEKMCTQITNAIKDNLKPQGVITVIEGRHSCLGCRGPKKAQASMVTTAFDGLFQDDQELKKEFLNIIQMGL